MLFFAEADMKIAVLKNKLELLEITGKTVYRLQGYDFTEKKLF